MPLRMRAAHGAIRTLGGVQWVGGMLGVILCGAVAGGLLVHGLRGQGSMMVPAFYAMLIFSFLTVCAHTLMGQYLLLRGVHARMRSLAVLLGAVVGMELGLRAVTHHSTTAYAELFGVLVHLGIIPFEVLHR